MTTQDLRQFNLGDRVRLVAPVATEGVSVGDEMTVVAIDTFDPTREAWTRDTEYRCRHDGRGMAFAFLASELARI